jgi:F-type H+-transporting ATPase subunit epsilon
VARTLICEIVTPERILYTNEVEMVIAPALDGEIGVLPLHAPMVAALKAGEVRVRYGTDRVEWFAISGGYLQVHEDKVMVLADDAAASGQIDVERARTAEAMARERLAELKAADSRRAVAAAESVTDEVDRLEAELKWAQVQVAVARHG